MKKTIGFIILIALVGIFACNKDTDDVTNDTFTQASAEEWFNTTFKESEEWKQNADSHNKIPDWSNGMYQKKDSLEIFEFPLVENKATISVPADKTVTTNDTKEILDATLSRIVIIKTGTNEIIVRKLYYVPEHKYLLSKGYDISNVMIGKSNDDFTGLLITKKWDDEVLSYHKVKNGKIEEMLVKYDVNDSKDNPQKSIRMDNYATAKTSGLDDEQNLDEVVINNNYHAPVTYVYLPSQPYYPTTSSSYNPYGTSGGGGTSTGTTTLSISQTIEQKIDDTQLDPCPKTVFEMLKNATNADIAAMLKKLGASKVYNVTLKMQATRSSYAETQRLSNYNYIIRVDRDRSTDGTKLYKATVLVHEVIHAYFLSLIDDAQNNSNSDLEIKFPKLFDAYVNTKYPNSTVQVDTQHKEMADNYVNAMASVLQEYDANSAVPYQVYKDLAWGGLMDAPIFAATFPPGSAESIRIKNRYQAESTGHAIGDGTPNAQSPVGKPCN